MRELRRRCDGARFQRIGKMRFDSVRPSHTTVRVPSAQADGHSSQQEDR